MSLRSFFRDEEDRLVLAQLPNPALWVFGLATLLRWSSYDSRDTELRWIGYGALIVWAADGIVRGAAPWRRLLGLVVLVWQLRQLMS